MSSLYKNKEDVIVSIEVGQTVDSISLEFSSDCGKHHTDESLDGFVITNRELLEILQDWEDSK